MLPECKECAISQMPALAERLGLDAIKLEELERIARETIEAYDNEDSVVTSAISYGRMWERIVPVLGTDDPYKEIKHEYNELALELVGEARAQLAASDDPLAFALRLAAAGNFIDFGAQHEIGTSLADSVFEAALTREFTIDDSAELTERIRSARRILYIADNCGEIVLDRVLIEEILHQNPNAGLTYVVRSRPVLNDVCMADAEQAGITKIARVITNGSPYPDPALILDHAGDELLGAWSDADLVIAKGQGNLEGLHGANRQDLFFVLMAKCDVMARICGCEPMNLVCASAAHLAQIDPRNAV